MKGRTFPWVRLGLLLGLFGLGAMALAARQSMRALQEQSPVRTRLMKLREQEARLRGKPWVLQYRWVPISRISPVLKRAVLAAEDDTFYQHPGVDLEAVKYSLQKNLKQRRFAQGGSTITQQVVKNLYLTPRKTLIRKLEEAVLALLLERFVTKPRILEIYLNTVEWGPGIFGAEAAARKFFGKPALDLSLDEAEALAAVLPSPLRHSPVREDRYLIWRKKWVARRMRMEGLMPAYADREIPETDAPGRFLRDDSGDSVAAEAAGDTRPAGDIPPGTEPGDPESLFWQEEIERPNPETEEPGGASEVSPGEE